MRGIPILAKAPNWRIASGSWSGIDCSWCYRAISAELPGRQQIADVMAACAEQRGRPGAQEADVFQAVE